MRRLGLAAILAVGLCAARPAEARRFALLVGDDQGDPVDARLRFAEVDARRMQAALQDVGDVAPGDATVLLGANADQVRQALDALQARLAREARPGDQLVLYFSSHADEGELHLEGGHLSLAWLDSFAARAPVDVVLLIVDSCHSGALTRLKGLRPAPGTDVTLEAPNVKGRVVIGSSGPNEYAQESDALGGSYFTSHLVAGLRGAADTSHDGVVSLQEAYDYAYTHTVESTYATQGGVQHPSYHLDLRGEGDLPLAHPAAARGRLRVALAQPGVLAVSDAATGALVGEFIKAAGDALLALPPGTYDVRVRGDASFLARDVVVPQDGEAVLRKTDLLALADAPGLTKGPEVIARAPDGPTDALAGLQLALGASYGTALTRSVPASPGVELGLGLPRIGGLPQLQLDLGARSAWAQGPVAYREQAVELRLGPTWGFAWHGVVLRAGPELGAVWVHQSALPRNATRDSAVAEGGAQVQLAIPIAGPLAAYAGSFAGAAWLHTDVQARFVLRAGASAGLALTL